MRLVLVMLLVASGCGTRPQTPTTPETGHSSVRLSGRIARLGGGMLQLDSLRGRAVLVVMFATWSLQSQNEAPRIVRVYEAVRQRRLAVIGVALDGPTPYVSTYVDFVAFRFPVLLAQPDDLDLVAAFGPTKQVPRTLLIDRQGQVIYDRSGATDFAALDRALAQIGALP